MCDHSLIRQIAPHIHRDSDRVWHYWVGRFLAWDFAFLASAIAYLRLNPLRTGALGGTIIWFSAAAFDSIHPRGVFLTVGVIMIALAVIPSSTRSTTSLT